MADRLNGKTALVTCAGAGIGRATALRFAAEGANVVVSDVNDDAARAVATEIGETSIVNHCDTSVEAEVEAAIAATVKAFGTVDILVNNAGVGGGVAWDRMIAINLSGVMYGCKHGAEAMAARGGGSIVNLSSMLGLIHPLLPLTGKASTGPHS
jgi:NAD(P)-dependent dehydrogenase (short-subunit alcohol dehydrogenase family)